MIQISDRPKIYWGYYQDYLVEIYEKTFQKKSPWFLSKFDDPWYERKIGKTGVAGDVQILA